MIWAGRRPRIPTRLLNHMQRSLRSWAMLRTSRALTWRELRTLSRAMGEWYTRLINWYNIYQIIRFFLAAEDPVQGAKDHEQVVKALADSPESVGEIEKFFFDNTRELIKASSYSPVVGKTQIIDIVRDVLKYVPLRWAATEIVSHMHNPNAYSLTRNFVVRLVFRSKPRRTAAVHTQNRNCTTSSVVFIRKSCRSSFKSEDFTLRP